jgi:hypothetical protein
LGDVLRPRDARDAGQATPAATMQTFLWAIAHGETNRFLQLIAIDAGADAQHNPAIWEEITKLFTDANNSSAKPAEGEDQIEIHLLEEQPGPNDDRWVVADTMQTNGVVNTEKVLLRPTDTGWKCVFGTNAAAVEEQITDQP